MNVTPQVAAGPVRARVSASELLAAFEALAPRLRVLSLDCFDTLLWRDTATPTDVFYDLQETPAFKALGYNAKLRVSSELAARQIVTRNQLLRESNRVDVLGASVRLRSDLGRGGNLAAGFESSFEWVGSAVERARLSEGAGGQAESLPGASRSRASLIRSIRPSSS